MQCALNTSAGRFARLTALPLLVLLMGCGDAGGSDSTASSQPPAERRLPDLSRPRPGSKAAAPGVPTSKHGDNSVQTWGREASQAVREEAATTVQHYLDARAAGDWAQVCRRLAVRQRREQERYGGGAPCPKAMASFSADASAAMLKSEAEIDVLSFRATERYGFLIYSRADGIFATALARKGDGWRLISVTPNPIR